ncbi:Alpha/Beta hydrolase protein [Lophiotrema nucula]|uniref:Alpha/Beta hydrolase protein n=1 Tax=Lophiotrema nucula TaxID=690887 RepID=A0A6A5Z8H6_9PLEO|nr:Alpha/Beta hydrolase protein [Lophiotrema nucula]
MDLSTKVRLALGLGLVLLSIPFWGAYLVPRGSRQHPRWSWRQALQVRCFRAVIEVLGRFRIGDTLSLNPGKEGERFIVMEPADPQMYTGILRCDESIMPETIGGTWYPERLQEQEGVEVVVLHFHGGGYTLGDGRSADCGFAASLLLEHTRATRVLCPQYRLSSTAGNRFPAAFQDAVTSYLYLLRTLGISAKDVVLSGDSAGGHMAIQLLRYLQEHGEELGIDIPKSAWLWSPWCDVATPLIDPTIVYRTPQYATDFLPNHDLIQWMAETYPPHSSTGIEVTNQWVSPLGYFFTLPCTLFVQVGGAELNYKEVTKWFEEMTAVKENREVMKLDVVDGAPHDIVKCGHLLGFGEEARKVVERRRNSGIRKARATESTASGRSYIMADCPPTSPRDKTLQSPASPNRGFSPAPDSGEHSSPSDTSSEDQSEGGIAVDFEHIFRSSLEQALDYSNQASAASSSVTDHPDHQNDERAQPIAELDKKNEELLTPNQDMKELCDINKAQLRKIVHLTFAKAKLEAVLECKNHNAEVRNIWGSDTGERDKDDRTEGVSILAVNTKQKDLIMLLETRIRELKEILQGFVKV